MSSLRRKMRDDTSKDHIHTETQYTLSLLGHQIISEYFLSRHFMT